jgi:hypothetical protein
MAAKSIYVRDFRKEIPGKLSDDRMAWIFPTVSSINANNKPTFWNIQVKLFNALATREVLEPPLFVKIKDSYFDSKPIVGIHAWIEVESGIVGGKQENQFLL